MSHWKTIADIRREYGQLCLSEETAKDCPIQQFEIWFAEVVMKEKSDPTAMVLSTVDAEGHPDSRVVLLKGIHDGAFVFYTNYQSTKAEQLREQPYVALNFYWPELSRQVRVRGGVRLTSKEQSDDYFASRPLLSQIGAVSSPQSTEIKGRSELEERFNALIEQHQQLPVVRPDHWGGYAVFPEQIEFWQGRDNRMHDRIVYTQQQKKWVRRRLAP
jgi:pyridoxamine 5'-phosphate oxidase